VLVTCSGIDCVSVVSVVTCGSNVEVAVRVEQPSMEKEEKKEQAPARSVMNEVLGVNVVVMSVVEVEVASVEEAPAVTKTVTNDWIGVKIAMLDVSVSNVVISELKDAVSLAGTVMKMFGVDCAAVGSNVVVKVDKKPPLPKSIVALVESVEVVVEKESLDASVEIRVVDEALATLAASL
jgi:hypothetical protein